MDQYGTNLFHLMTSELVTLQLASPSRFRIGSSVGPHPTAALT